MRSRDVSFFKVGFLFCFSLVCLRVVVEGGGVLYWMEGSFLWVCVVL